MTRPYRFLLLLALAAAPGACGRPAALPLEEVARLESENRRLADTLAKTEERRLRVDRELKAQRPRGTYIVVDSFRNRIRLMKDDRVLLEDACSTGNGRTLADSTSGQSWTFRTPRGRRTVTAAPVSDPVWIRPDWAFVEEGLPLPRDPRMRAESGVLGSYALAIGDGYFIHGTLYTRLLGYPVTHGCIRVGDATLTEIVSHARVGTPVLIY